MKCVNRVLSSVFLFVWILTSGCGSSSGPVMQWDHLSEQSSCEAMNPAYCPSTYGFTVDTQGNFTAGPSPSGKTVQGKITAQELATLNSDANAILLAGAGLHCMNKPSVPGSSDQITAFSAGTMQATVYSEDFLKGECFAHSQAAATTLRDFFHQLRTEYYPIPFPS